MFDRIERIPAKKLLGRSLKMSLIENRTYSLWSSFMPLRNKITDRVGDLLYSIQVYDASLDFKDFSPATTFTKWAAAEVSDFDHVPESLAPYQLKGGLYAVFIHKGTPASFPKTAQYIFGQWLPSSDYELDQREHFEVFTSDHKPDDPESEEEVWIPIKKMNEPG